MQPVTRYVSHATIDFDDANALSLSKKLARIIWQLYALAIFIAPLFTRQYRASVTLTRARAGFVMPGFLGSADGKKRSRPEVEVEVEIEAMRAYSPTPLLSRHRRSLVSAISYLSTVYASYNKNTFHHRPRRSSKSASTCVGKHAYLTHYALWGLKNREIRTHNITKNCSKDTPDIIIGVF